METTEMNEENEEKPKNFHELELDDRILKVGDLKQQICEIVCERLCLEKRIQSKISIK